MTFLLPQSDEWASLFGWSRNQKIALITVNYLVLATYCFLVALTLRNIVVILVKQREYKNLPILAFYFYSLLAVILRTIYVIW